MSVHKRYELYFFTATILQWKNLLKPEKYKDVIVDSLRFLVRNNRVAVNGFVIMNNHIHIIWQIGTTHSKKNIQRDFLNYTAQTIKFDLLKYHPEVLQHFKVGAKDRTYQIWERNPLWVDVRTEAVLTQKLRYIHENPVRAGFVENNTDYFYSSAAFYETGNDDWGFLTQF